jgi:hypothetical protein
MLYAFTRFVMYVPESRRHARKRAVDEFVQPVRVELFRFAGTHLHRWQCACSAGMPGMYLREGGRVS